MKSPRLILWVVVAILLAVGISLFFSRKRPAHLLSESTLPSVQERPRVFFVELNETNKDGFQKMLFIPDAPVSSPPFWLREDQVVIPEEVLQAIREGTEKRKFRLFLDKPGMDVEKEAQLFLIHRIQFDGVGREGGFADYYIFSRYPAQVTLPVQEKPQDAVHLGVNDSVTQTFQIRLIPDPALTLSREDSNRLAVLFAGKKSVLPPQGEELLSRLSQATTVTQEIFAPLPKGEVRPEDFQVLSEEFGTVNFSTELSVKNLGQREVQVEKK